MNKILLLFIALSVISCKKSEKSNLEITSVKTFEQGDKLEDVFTVNSRFEIGVAMQPQEYVYFKSKSRVDDNRFAVNISRAATVKSYTIEITNTNGEKITYNFKAK